MNPASIASSCQKPTLLEDGIVVCHGATSPEDVGLVRDAAYRAYEIVEAAQFGIEPSGPHAELAKHIAQSTIQWGGMAICHALDIANNAEAVAAFARIVELVQKIAADFRGRSGAIYRGELSYFRRHNGAATHVPWHFDAGAAGTAVHEPCFNAWMPLVQVGSDCPTLQFLPRTGSRMKAGEFTASKPGFPDDTWITQNIRDQDPLTPALNPGDVIIFDHWTLHRTQPLSGNVKMRTSAEIRLSPQDLVAA